MPYLKRRRAAGDPVARFWSKVLKLDGDGCWLWKPCKGPRDYGQFGLPGGKVVLAHRYSFELANGPIPDGLCCLHRCDTPACVRPTHLFLGTRRHNSADMVAKGRQARGAALTGRRDSARISAGQRRRARDKPESFARGAAVGNAALNRESVIALRLRREEGASYSTLAKEFGVSIGTAHNVANKYTYSDV